jgi:hypothetical protein
MNEKQSNILIDAINQLKQYIRVCNIHEILKKE